MYIGNIANDISEFPSAFVGRLALNLLIHVDYIKHGITKNITDSPFY